MPPMTTATAMAKTSITPHHQSSQDPQYSFPLKILACSLVLHHSSLRPLLPPVHQNPNPQKNSFFHQNPKPLEIFLLLVLLGHGKKKQADAATDATTGAAAAADEVVQCDSACCKHCGLQEMGVTGDKRAWSFA
jgi:hypothetical protein